MTRHAGQCPICYGIGLDISTHRCHPAAVGTPSLSPIDRDGTCRTEGTSLTRESTCPATVASDFHVTATLQTRRDRAHALVAILATIGLVFSGLALSAPANAEDTTTDTTTVVETVTVDEPVAVETVTEEPPADEVVTEDPPADEVVTEEPPADEVVTEEPPADEVVTEEPGPLLLGPDTETSTKTTTDTMCPDPTATDVTATDATSTDCPATEDAVVEVFGGSIEP